MKSTYAFALVGRKNRVRSRLRGNKHVESQYPVVIKGEKEKKNWKNATKNLLTITPHHTTSALQKLTKE